MQKIGQQLCVKDRNTSGLARRDSGEGQARWWSVCHRPHNPEVRVIFTPESGGFTYLANLLWIENEDSGVVSRQRC